MLHIGLTGNIGSGKSTVARIFEILGVPVYHADMEAKKFLDHQEVLAKLVTRFGERILGDDGTVDKRELATIVFSNDDALRDLNSLIHPLVRADAKAWIEKNQSFPFVIHEAAIIFESGFSKDYDGVIHVACDPDVALHRVVQRDGTTEEEVRKRMRHQWNNDEKSRLADFVLNNNGTELLIPQVLDLYKILNLKKFPSTKQ